MIWSDFKALVRVFLHAHNRRQGIQTLIDTLIKAAVQDLQSSIPELRKGNLTTITLTRWANTGYAATYKLAPQAVITDVYSQSADDFTKLSFFQQHPLNRVRDMVLGLINSQESVYTYEPASGILAVSPLPRDNNTNIIVVWDTKNAEYTDDTDVIFDLAVAEAVAAYVMITLAATVDKDPVESARHGTIFRQKKRRIFSDFAESGVVRARVRRPACGLPLPVPFVPGTGSDLNGDFGGGGGGTTPGAGSDFSQDFNNDFGPTTTSAPAGGGGSSGAGSFNADFNPDFPT